MKEEVKIVNGEFETVSNGNINKIVLVEFEFGENKTKWLREVVIVNESDKAYKISYDVFDGNTKEEWVFKENLKIIEVIGYIEFSISWFMLKTKKQYY